MAKKIAQSIGELVGHTPLLELSNIEGKYSLKAKVVVKLEYFNPAGSVKDRVALAMIDDGIKQGLIKKDTLIIEPTSGNTGIGLAAIACSRGLSITLTMPDTMSKERRTLLKAYGARLVLTEGSRGMKGAIDKAQELHREIPNSFIPGQFTNPINPLTHYNTTGPEIWQDTAGELAAFVAGVGTGGTLSGVGKYLKERDSNIKVIAVEPASSPVLSKGCSGSHKIQGIGAGFIPEILDTTVYDEVLAVGDDAALNMGRQLAATEGILVGISSGAAVWAAIELAKRACYEGKTIVALLPDTGDRYLSTVMFNQ